MVLKFAAEEDIPAKWSALTKYYRNGSPEILDQLVGDHWVPSE